MGRRRVLSFVITALVAAIRANSSLPEWSDIHEPGVLYRCPLLQEGRPCKQVVVEASGNEDHPNNVEYLRYYDLKDNMTLGMSMDVSSKGDILVCAPLWKNQKWPGVYLPNGACYVLDKNFRRLRKLVPLIKRLQQAVNMDYYYYAAEMGFSAAFTKVFLFDFDAPWGGRATPIKARLYGGQMCEYFGASLLAVDLDKDGDGGMDDLLVGAPMYTHPDGMDEGRVYVYRSSGSRIAASSVSSRIGVPLKGFGISISKGFDVDSNRYQEVETELSIDVKRVADNRPVRGFMYNNVTQVNKYSSLLTARVNHSTCETRMVYLQAVFADPVTPFVTRLEYRLREPSEQRWCPTCPVLDKDLPQAVTQTIPYQHGCRSDDVCRSDLKLNVELTNYE
ncbi:integrin alpha, putative [Ixodes scapularis]|uniref:Integrin alpha, putative n=1 Tax=Ixodes scapularis TaxID=6945 RepID=B7PDC6_IXOSC|nr:integrin alpha, putative [Ixodes scapularis]|eukprot:XP_002410728.1 integrin alpha, putative [Ixodes scapularis]